MFEAPDHDTDSSMVTKTLLQVILSHTKFQFYGLGVYCKPPRLLWPLCLYLYPLPPSSATFQRLVPPTTETTDPPPFPRPPRPSLPLVAAAVQKPPF